MSKCERCQQSEASVYLQETVAGLRRSVGLCAPCAAGSSSPDAAPGPAAPACSGCGLTLEQVQTERRFGCEQCYEALGELLLGQAPPPLRGKRPQAPGQPPVDGSRTDLRRGLHQQLQAAVASEDYEQAALLRDRLAVLGKGGNDAS